MADGQDLLFSERGEIAGVVRERAHIGRHGRNVRQIGKVVVVTAEPVGRLIGIKGIGHTQQLLGADDGVVGASVGIQLCLQEHGSITPVDVGKRTLEQISAADRHSEQAVGIGHPGMGFHE